MTPLEIIMLAIIWIAVGIYICYKRDWYPSKGYDDFEPETTCIVMTILAPINLAIVLFRLFFMEKWNNN